MKLINIIVCLILLSVSVKAQEGLPKDYLPAKFHKERRENLRKKMPKNSVAVFFANPIRNRSNDIDYVYHQDPNFYYLTGYKEPHSVLVIFSENQTDTKGDSYNDILYVQEKNPAQELWSGYRVGVSGAKSKLGFKKVFIGSAFKNSAIDFKSFDTVLFFPFNNDSRDFNLNKADLFDLQLSFKSQIGFEPIDNDANSTKNQIYSLIKATTVENSANVAQYIGRVAKDYPDLKNDEIINKFINTNDNNLIEELKQQIISAEAETPTKNFNTKLLHQFMSELREVKTAEELKLLRKAIRISAIGQREVMKAMHPRMSEAEIQGIHEFVYKKYGVEYEGYPSIVGSGNNGCVLHYIENSKTKVANDLVLMDLGAEYHGYTADVTRTIPANGKFTTEQKLIYDIVYQAQEAGIAAATVGSPFIAPHMATTRVIKKGLAKLGIIKNENSSHNYFPHGTSHYLGLDVHDPGSYGNLQANSIITVEPGIYIPEGSDCDKKWWGIAVRIEDDILITEKGPVNLSDEAPRTTEAIELLMKQESPLDHFKIPKVD